MDIDLILKQLTPEEKVALLQGWSQWTTMAVPRLGIPSLFLADGPHGLCKQMAPDKLLWSRKTLPATCFPTAATMANSWDPELGEELGRALGEEAAAADVHVVLGPGLNIKRSPLCGRNFEYFSEDPYLSGKLAAAYIRGMQEKGPAACPKHFAANSQELRRMVADSVVDERTLREIYLTGFEIAVREGKPGSIMSSYNRVNGVYANENPHLLTDILRNEWGFDGFVVTDWGADNDHAAGVRAGSNLVMPCPGPDAAIQLQQAWQDGSVTEADLNARLRELLKTAFTVDAAVRKAPHCCSMEDHHQLARKCAAESIVLLDNDGILPLQRSASVAVIGDFAKTPRYQGAGSSLVLPGRLDNLLDSLRESGVRITGYASGFCRTNPKPDPAQIREAVSLAASAEIVLLCIGLEELMETEGMDRNSLDLSAGQQALVEAVAAANRNIVLVLCGGAPFIMPERSLYRAAVHGYLGGQAGSAAMADVLTGTVNPSGKLAETWPHRLEDTPAHPYYLRGERNCEYREGLFVGYRYYTTADIPVRYPFGYGLSYTAFRYSDLQVTPAQVTFTLTNTGTTDGSEIAQVYISCPESNIYRPKQELKGFRKVFLTAGESKTVTIPLDDKAFRYYNVASNAWETEPGIYEVSVAASVSDLRLTASLQIDGKPAQLPSQFLPSYENGKIHAVSDEEFEKLLGHPVPDGSWSGRFEKNDALCQLQLVKTIPAQLIYKIVRHLKEKAEAKCPPDLNMLFIFNMPFRGISKLTAGMFSSRMVDDLLLAVNGHFFRGTGKLIADHFRNRRDGKTFLKKLPKQK